MAANTEIECPQWLNASFIAQAFAEEQPPPSSLEIIKCSSVVGDGDNYLSQMLRVTVKVTTAEGQTREDSLVVKSLETTDKTMKEYGIFQKEVEMFTSVLRVYEGFWKEHGQDVKFGAKCFISVSQPFDVLVLSDLKVDSYVMADRFDRLSLEQAKLTLSKLAKFHASGVLYKERDLAPLKVAQRKYIDKAFASVLGHMLPVNLKALDKKMKEIGIDQSYIDKVSKWQTSLLPTIARATDPDCYPSDFHTLLHGDLWLNNEMFKYDEQKQLQDVVFVDYQMSSYGNPMSDFVYFVFTSIPPAVVVEHMDALSAYYHSELAQAMSTLKVRTQVPSLDQLNVQLQRAAPYVATLLLDIIPIIIMDRIKLENKNNLMTAPDTGVLEKLCFHKYNNPRFEEVLKTLLPFWDKRGYLSSQLTLDDLPEYLKQEKTPEPVVTVASVEAVPVEGKDNEAARPPVPAPRSNSTDQQLAEEAPVVVPAAVAVEEVVVDKDVEVASAAAAVVEEVAVIEEAPVAAVVVEEVAVIKQVEVPVAVAVEQVPVAVVPVVAPVEVVAEPEKIEVAPAAAVQEAAVINEVEVPIVVAPVAEVVVAKDVEVAAAAVVEDVVQAVEEVKAPAPEIIKEQSVIAAAAPLAEEINKEEAVVTNGVHAVEQPDEIICIAPAVVVETPTSPTIVVEPWPSTQQEAKPKRLLKARIEETINKFAAMEANGHSKPMPEGRAADLPAGYPKWLDKFFFVDLLRKEYSSFKVFKFNVAPANPKGENYASQMFRTKLSLETNQAGLVNRSFMVKVNHESGPAAQMMALLNLFPKEIEMYSSILPKFESMYHAVGEKNMRLSPKCVLGTRDPADLIILEDLSLEGFKCVDRTKGLDMEHVELTISKLAKMHAASVVYMEQGGKFDEKFNEGIYSEKMLPIFDSFMQPNIDALREVTQDWKCAKTLNKYYDNWREIFFNRLFPATKKDESRFNVLCHGDLWCNNVMFKYSSEGKVQDVLLVDFQICNVNSPMLDLHYFIVSSLQNSVRLSKIDYIISFYQRELSSNMKKLGAKTAPPTLLQLQKDFLATGQFGLGTAFGTLSIAVAPASDISDINSLLPDSPDAKAFKRNMYANPTYREAMEELIPHFERKGYFEV